MNDRRSRRLQWLAGERAAAPVRAELRTLLTALGHQWGIRLELVEPRQGVPDPLLARYSARELLRLPAMSLDAAIAETMRLAERRAPEVWLIRPGRPERVGLIRASGSLNSEALAQLARWDGEGLLIGSEAGRDWILLDIIGPGDEAQAELLMSPEELPNG